MKIKRSNTIYVSPNVGEGGDLWSVEYISITECVISHSGGTQPASKAEAIAFAYNKGLTGDELDGFRRGYVREEEVNPPPFFEPITKEPLSLRLWLMKNATAESCSHECEEGKCCSHDRKD